MSLATHEALRVLQFAKQAYYLSTPDQKKHTCTSISESTGFAGFADIDIANKEIVFAFCGTQIYGGLKEVSLAINDVVSNLALAFNQDIPQMQDAFKFFESCMKSLDLAKDFKIILTGHSLGGAIAEILTAYAIKENYSNIETLTFDSPGTLEYVNKYYGKDIAVKIQHNVKSVIVEPNIINTFGDHIGKVYTPNTNLNSPFTHFANIIKYISDLFNHKTNMPGFIKNQMHLHNTDTMNTALSKYHKDSLIILSSWNDRLDVGLTQNILKHFNIKSGIFKNILEMLHKFNIPSLIEAGVDLVENKLTDSRADNVDVIKATLLDTESYVTSNNDL